MKADIIVTKFVNDTEPHVHKFDSRTGPSSIARGMDEAALAVYDYAIRGKGEVEYIKYSPALIVVKEAGDGFDKATVIEARFR